MRFPADGFTEGLWVQANSENAEDDQNTAAYEASDGLKRRVALCDLAQSTPGIQIENW